MQYKIVNLAKKLSGVFHTTDGVVTETSPAWRTWIGRRFEGAEVLDFYQNGYTIYVRESPNLNYTRVM